MKLTNYLLTRLAGIALALAFTASMANATLFTSSTTIDGQTNPSIINDSGTQITTYKADGINPFSVLSLPTEIGTTYSWFETSLEYIEVFEEALSGEWAIDDIWYTMDTTDDDRTFMESFFQPNESGSFSIVTYVELHDNGRFSYRANYAEFYEDGTKLRWANRDTISGPYNPETILLSRTSNFLVYNEVTPPSPSVTASTPSTLSLLSFILFFLMYNRKLTK